MFGTTSQGNCVTKVTFGIISRFGQNWTIMEPAPHIKEGPMLKFAALLLAVSCFQAVAQEPTPVRPKAGKVELFKQADLKPGMKGYAWTVFSGTEPEAIPVEIVGILKNQWGPKQDIILGKLGGKAIRTNVAGGMSGSPGQL